MNSVPILEVAGVTKRYGALVAVNDLSLAVPQGVCLGLLGPNGAGKTTLVEIIEGIISPTSGRVLYRGRERSAVYREKIGIMFQQTALTAFMTVEETLKTFRDLYPQAMDIAALIRMCHLEDIRKQLNDKISGGQRQRLLLALALVNQPELLFLDEPSTGLDPQARRNLWDIVTGVKREGKTIILTTHYMEEAQELCDIVAVMDHGRIIAMGSPEQLIERYTQGVQIVFPIGIESTLPDNLGFEMIKGDHHLALQVDDINATVQTLLAKGVNLSRMAVHTPTLETVFLNLTGRQLRD